MHVRGQLFHSTFVLTTHSLLVKDGGAWNSGHLPLKLENRRLNGTKLWASRFPRRIHCIDKNWPLIISWFTELKRAFWLLSYLIDFVVAEARLAHWNFVECLPRHLLMKGKFGHVLSLGKRIREVIKKLETVIVDLVNWEGRSFRLQIEVYEACWPWLQLRLVTWIHCAELCRVEFMVVKGLFACLVLAWLWLNGAKSISLSSIHIFLVPLREEFFVFPHFI